MFACSAVSPAKAIFIHRPFIYHHSTLVGLEPPPAAARAIPINIMDLWVDVFPQHPPRHSHLYADLPFFQCCRQPDATYKSKRGPLRGITHQGRLLFQIKTSTRVLTLTIQSLRTAEALWIMTWFNISPLRIACLSSIVETNPKIIMNHGQQSAAGDEMRTSATVIDTLGHKEAKVLQPNPVLLKVSFLNLD